MDFNDLSYEQKQYLMHHGIEGQKWGVTNGPPYPLDRQTHNSIIKSSKNDSENTNNSDELGFTVGLIPFILWETGIVSVWTSAIAKAAYNKHVEKKEMKTIEENLKENEDYYKTKESTQAKAIYESIKSNKDVPEEYQRDTTKDLTKDELKNINERPKSEAARNFVGASNNCTYCSTSYVLNRKGYAVQASRSQSGNISGWLESNFDNVTTDNFVTSKSMKTYLENKENGSYGTVSLMYDQGGGHAMNWEKQNGKVYMVDAQNATKMSYKTWLKTYEPNFSSVIENTESGKVSYGVQVSDMTNSSINWDKIIKNVATR